MLFTQHGRQPNSAYTSPRPQARHHIPSLTTMPSPGSLDLYIERSSMSSETCREGANTTVRLSLWRRGKQLTTRPVSTKAHRLVPWMLMENRRNWHQSFWLLLFTCTDQLLVRETQIACTKETKSKWSVTPIYKPYKRRNWLYWWISYLILYSYKAKLHQMFSLFMQDIHIFSH
jgi:hypothetical protein